MGVSQNWAYISPQDIGKETGSYREYRDSIGFFRDVRGFPKIRGISPPIILLRMENENGK